MAIFPLTKISGFCSVEVQVKKNWSVSEQLSVLVKMPPTHRRNKSREENYIGKKNNRLHDLLENTAKQYSKLEIQQELQVKSMALETVSMELEQIKKMYKNIKQKQSLSVAETEKHAMDKHRISSLEQNVRLLSQEKKGAHREKGMLLENMEMLKSKMEDMKSEKYKESALLNSKKGNNFQEIQRQIMILQRENSNLVLENAAATRAVQRLEMEVCKKNDIIDELQQTIAQDKQLYTLASDLKNQKTKQLQRFSMEVLEPTEMDQSSLGIATPSEWVPVSELMNGGMQAKLGQYTLETIEEGLKALPLKERQETIEFAIGLIHQNHFEDPDRRLKFNLSQISNEAMYAVASFLAPIIHANPTLEAKLFSKIHHRRLVDMKFVIQTNTEVTLEEEKPKSSIPRSPSKMSAHVQRSPSRRVADDGSDPHCFILVSEEDPSNPILHGPREIHPTKTIYRSKPTKDEQHASHDRDSEAGSSTTSSSQVSRFGRARKGASNSTGGIKEKVATILRSKHDHGESGCDGCNKLFGSGNQWICDCCERMALCDSCYSQGMHGFETSLEIFHRIEYIICKKCTSLQQEKELLELLRQDICKLNKKKFSFCLSWIADIISGKSTKELKARALEIPRVKTEVRVRFYKIVERIVQHRKDLDVHLEYSADHADDGTSKGKRRKDSTRELLRIWVKDKYKSTSPFLDRSNKKDGVNL